MVINKRHASELLSPETQEKSGKRQLLSSPPGFGAIFKLNKEQIDGKFSESELKNELGDISEEGLRIALIINKRIKQVVCDLVGSLEYYESQQSTLLEEKATLQKQIAGMETELRELNRGSSQNSAKSVDLDNYSRRSNLLIKGIPEGWNQNNEEVVRSFLTDYFGVPYDVKIERTHRIGRFYRRWDGSIKPRPIIVRFSFFEDREKVWNLRRNLQWSRYSLDEDFAPETQAVRRKLLPVLAEAKRRKLGKKIELVKDTIKIDGKTYNVNTLHNLPKEVRDGSRWTNDQVTFFGELCPASNFHPAKFDHNGMTVENSEKMLFFKKAKLFNDNFTANRIEKESDPRIIKSMSKHIQGADEREWNDQIQRLVTPILIDKFRQNKPLLNWLRETGSRTLVEAAGPHDKVWGNGLFLSDDNINDPSKWTGTNLQGKMLMAVREHLCPESIFPERVQQLLNLGHVDDEMDDDDDKENSQLDLPASQGFEAPTSPKVLTEDSSQVYADGNQSMSQRDRTSSFHIQFDAPSSAAAKRLHSKSSSQ